MDRIKIENLELIGTHGVFKEEKFLGQKFIISLDMKTDTRHAGLTGDLSSSTHYGFVSDDVDKLFTSTSFDLIETCAEKIAEMILIKYPLIKEVTVTVKKPWAPIRKHFDFVAVEITRSWHTAYISLGSNMGDKKANLLKATDMINSLPHTEVIKSSTILETEPYGYVDQDMFLNSCIKVKTLSPSYELMTNLLNIEKSMGRIREIKWGPRIIDLDILLFDKEVNDSEHITLPHPYMHDRLFVLEPLAEIAPYAVHPLLNKTVMMMKSDLTNLEKK